MVPQGRLLTTPEDKFDSLTLLYHLSWSSVLPLGLYSVRATQSHVSDVGIGCGCRPQSTAASV